MIPTESIWSYTDQELFLQHVASFLSEEDFATYKATLEKFPYEDKFPLSWWRKTAIHTSLVDPTKVAYVRSLQAARENKEVRISLERFKQRHPMFKESHRFMEEWSDKEAQKVLEQFTLELVHMDEGKWYWAYRQIRSCMTECPSLRRYLVEESPIRLALIYHDGLLVARAIVNDETKKFYSVYSESYSRLHHRFLEANGYEDDELFLVGGILTGVGPFLDGGPYQLEKIADDRCLIKVADFCEDDE